MIGAGTRYSAYVRGQAYLAMHQGREAAIEFQKILDHRGIVLSDPIGGSLSPICNWGALTRLPASMTRRARPMAILSVCGRTPTPTSLF